MNTPKADLAGNLLPRQPPSAKSGLRAMLPAVFMLGQAVAFLLVFRNSLGGLTAPIVPHLALAILLTASVYGLAIIIGIAIPRRLPRSVLLWLLGLASILVTSVFYLSATFTLYGFRDLPTRGVISGYFTQLPAMLASLPISRVTLGLVGTGMTVILLAASTGIAWGLAELRTRINTPTGPRIRPAIAIAPLAVLLLLVVAPPPGFITRFEPWLRSLYNRPLAESGLGLQANPVEEARDQRLEAEYPATPMGKRHNVILIYIDGLRADVLEPYGSGIPNMPFMQSLVANGEIQQFPRTFSSCSMTLCGLGSLLQSRPAHRVSPGNLSLHKVLQRQGYETRYLLSGDHQHFLALKQYYGPTQDFYMDGIDLDPVRSNDDLAVFTELHRLPVADAAQKPQFIMLGLMSVHIWGKRHDEFRRWRPDKLTTISFSSIDDNSVEAYRNNYMNGILQADHVLKTIWHWLDSSDYLKNSIVVITSDHGDSLGENGHLGHARSLNTPELLIPLWIHAPTGAVPIRSPVFQDDIAPTVLNLLDLPIPSSWTGHSLLKPSPRERWYPLYYINSKDKFGLILVHDGKTLKYLVDHSLHTENVYDLDNDLFEQRDIRDSIPPKILDAFRAQLQASFGTILADDKNPRRQ